MYKNSIIEQGEEIDSLHSINYQNDTVCIFENYDGLLVCNPDVFIVTRADMVWAGSGSVKHINPEEGWPFYYDNFHLLLIDAVRNMDLEQIKSLVKQFGQPGIEHPILASRIIIKDYQVKEYVVFKLPYMYFGNFTTQHKILY